MSLEGTVVNRCVIPEEMLTAASAAVARARSERCRDLTTPEWNTLCLLHLHAWSETPLPKNQALLDYLAVRRYECLRCGATKMVEVKS
jgi:hypothetical protein